MTCSGTDAFRIDALLDFNYGEVLSGCYEDSGQLATSSELPVFTVGGVREHGQPAIYAYNSSSAGHDVWTFGVSADNGSLVVWYCTDADLEDAHVLGHPTNVRQWYCWDVDDQTLTENEDYITTTCGCEGAPSPWPSETTSLTPSPDALESAASTSVTYTSSSDKGAVSCSRTDAFRADVVNGYVDEDNLGGCYQESGAVSTANLLPIFTVGGVDADEQTAFFAYSPTALDHDVWTIGLWDDSSALIGGYCVDAYSEDAHVLGHPTNVLRWDCWDEDDQAHTNVDYVATTCGCDGSAFPKPRLTPTPVVATPAPVTPSTPAPEIRHTFGPAEPRILTPSLDALGTLVPTLPPSVSSYEGAARDEAPETAPMGIIVGGVATGSFVAGIVVMTFLSKASRRRMSNTCIMPRDPEKSL